MPEHEDRPPKTALIHYWLTEMRGGEKVLEALCDMFPDADIFTHVLDRDKISQTISRHRIRTTFVNNLPVARRLFRWYLPFMPIALEQLDLSEYELIISTESGPAKGVIAPLSSVHICYCLSPMRYAWDLQHEYLRSVGPLVRLIMRPLLHYLRLWDLASAARVDHFIAISQHTRRRIRKYYGRDAEVIHPGIDLDDFSPTTELSKSYLMVGQLTHYKRPDLAVEAFNRLGRPLIVIGRGEELRQLQKHSGPNITFLGWQPDEVLRRYYATCRALIFPGTEDFGIVPVEAMASGRPVIAYAGGGALETVIDGVTGLLFREQTAQSLIEAVETYENTEHAFSSETIAAHAQRFSKERFRQQMCEAVNRVRHQQAAIDSAGHTIAAP